MVHLSPAEADPRIEDAARIVLRPIASPVPLGMLALAMGSVLLTALQLQWIAPAYGGQVATVVLAFVVPLEAVAAVFGFLARDVVMATGFGLLTGSWAAVGVLLRTIPPGGTSTVLGILAIAAASALLVPAITAGPAKPVATVVMAVAALRFAATGVYELGGTPGWRTGAGIVGIVLLGTSLYGSLALALEDARHRTILPVQRLTTSAEAMSGRYAEQLHGLATETGVRQEA